jgi:hypothetical protein
MNDLDETAYLSRAFDRFGDEAIDSVHVERQGVMSLGTKQGLSGTTLVNLQTVYFRVGADTMGKMVRLAYDIAGTTGPVVEALEQGLRALRDMLSNDLADYFRSQRVWAPSGATEAVSKSYLQQMDQRIAGIVDDFSHGFLRGNRLTKDPLVSVVTSVTNSPGAVVQSGLGNVQKVLSASGTNDARSALAQFLQSREVQALAPDDKKSVMNAAAAVDGELSKPTPDPSRIAKFGRSLLDIAKQLGVAVAATSIDHALFK